MDGIQAFFLALGAYKPPDMIQYIIAGVLTLMSFAVLGQGVFSSTLRWNDRREDQSSSIMPGLLGGVMIGLLWYLFNPIKVVPPYIHERLFAFLPPLVGLVYGRGNGFIAGYVATLVWAFPAGAFVLFHSPIADGIFVGLTGWIPAHILRGNLDLKGLYEKINANPTNWYLSSGVVCLFTGIFMAFFVALSLAVFAPAVGGFWVGFWAIGVVSDTLPMVLFTGLTVQLALSAMGRQRATAPSY